MFLDFKSVENIRDLGGIKTIDNHIIKDKCLLRSADLHTLNNKELNVLKNEYNLKMVIDFRSTKSSNRKKDLIDSSIIYHHIFVLKVLENNSYTRDITVAPDEFFLNVYRSLALNEEAIHTYKQFFDYLVSVEDGAVLYHCTSGKDRTGVATILILYALGCDKDTIYKEHFKTNEYTSKQYNKQMESIKNPTKFDQDYYEAFYIAKKIYIDEYFKVIEEKYGSFEYYFSKVIGIDKKTVNILRKRYLK